MYKIVLIGTGNVAYHLIEAFNKTNNAEIIQVYGRDVKILEGVNSKYHIDYTDDLHNLKNADLYLIAITDSAIAKVSSNLPFTNRLVAHTSGATDISIIDDKNKRAVFYPLQSFTKGKSVDFANIPILVEAGDNNDSNSNKDITVLKNIASTLSNNVKEISSVQRQYLHVGAVYVNNFTNHMFSIAKDILHDAEVDFDLLKPLIAETVEKINSTTPIKAQTGPAKRGDVITEKKHLELIINKDYKDVYEVISKSIKVIND
ncbi:MAG: DUF2520 domain-containing protein [Ichthyobacteriaceae bacterium]|nr:DUF2520 domain-containing protein [Ichthyobacteriaceae bacterium]